MNRFPKITPGDWHTYNRKFRRALTSIAVLVAEFLAGMGQ